MKRFVLGALGIVVLIVAVAQLVPYGRADSNPPVVQEPAWDSAQTRALFARACNDCHSNETVWPAYSYVAPISWLVVHDTLDGRRQLNFSAWGDAQLSGREARAESQQDPARDQQRLDAAADLPAHAPRGAADRRRETAVDRWADRLAAPLA